MNLGFPEMIFIFLLALIVFGPRKLPEIGRQIGRALNEFKRASNEFKSQIESEIGHLDVPETKFDFRDLTNKILQPAEPAHDVVPAGALPRVVERPAESAVPTEATVPPPPDLTNAAKAPDA